MNVISNGLAVLFYIKVFFVTLIPSVYAEDFSFYALEAFPAAYKENGNVRGYYADILRRVGEEIGQEDIRVIVAPYSRILYELNENTSGFVLTCLFPNTKFNDNVYQPSNVAYFKTGVISMSSDPFTWKNATGKRVATVRGASQVYGDKFHDRIESGDIELISVTDYQHAMRMLRAGRINGFAGNLGPILYNIKNENLAFAEPAVIAEKISKITISAAIGAVSAEETVKKVGQVVERLLANGEIQAIIENYLPNVPQPRQF